jgi:hypothetical protein
MLSICRFNAIFSAGVRVDGLLEEALSSILENILCERSSSNQKFKDTVKLGIQKKLLKLYL